MKDREFYNEWEGFDGGEHVYNEKIEKRNQARIWWCLSIIFIGVFISIFARQIRDYVDTRSCEVITTRYSDDDNVVIYIDGNGNEQTYVLPSYPVKKENGNVLLYIDKSGYINTVASFWRWLPFYVLYGILSALSVWRLCLVYFRRRHSFNGKRDKEAEK